MKSFWGAVRQKAHKHTATAVSRDLERAVAGLWKGRERKRPGRGRRRTGGKTPSHSRWTGRCIPCGLGEAAQTEGLAHAGAGGKQIDATGVLE